MTFFAAADTELAAVEIHPQLVTPATSLNYQIFERSDFLGRYTTVSELLQQSAGIQVRYHGLGSQAVLSVRGSNHDQIRLMIDGQFVENPQYGGFDIDQIPLSQIESIELIKGYAAGTTQHAIGGVVKITRVNTPEGITDVQASVGEYGYRQLGLHHNRELFGRMTIGLDTAHAGYDYETNITSPVETPNERNTLQALNNNQQSKRYAQLNWRSNYSSTGLVKVLIEHRDRKKHVPNYFHNSDTNNTYYSQSHNTQSVGYEYLTSNALQLNTDLIFESHNDRYYDRLGTTGFYPQDIRYQYSQIQMNQGLKQQIGNYHWQVSFSAIDHRYEDNHTLTEDSAKCISVFAACDLSSTRQQFAIATEHRTHLSTLGTLTLNAGFDSNTYHVEERLSKANDRTSNIDLPQWALAYNLALTPSLKTAIAINKANRLPTLMELYGNLGAVKGNQSLDAEKAINYSFDISWKETQSIGFFYRELTDKITVLYDSQGIGSYDNTQQAKLIGVELETQWQYKNFSVYASHLTQTSQTKSDIKSFDQQKLAGIYHKSTSLTATYNMYINHSFTLQNALDEGLYLDASNVLEGSSRRVSNLGYIYQGRHLIFKFAINNIFDYRYLDQSNHQAAGRNLLLQTTYSF